MHPFLKHLIVMGATLEGQNTPVEIQEVEQQLAIRLPSEIHDYLTSFRTCEFTHGPMWDFFTLKACVERTLVYRQHHRSIQCEELKVSTAHILAFCDALIDAPTYFVVAHKDSAHYGMIVGAHGDKGWIVGDGLDDFLCAFKREWEIALISNK